MCDYSLMAVPNRLAQEGEELVAHRFPTGSMGLASPADVKREMDWLVRNGPKTGLFLGGSSSIAPGVSWENMKTLVEGFKYYREHGRI